MGPYDIHVNLKSLIYKKGLFLYLENWGFSPKSISREGLISSISPKGFYNPILICDEEILEVGSSVLGNYKVILMLDNFRKETSVKLLEKGINGLCSFEISPADFHQAIKVVINDGKYIQPNLIQDNKKKVSGSSNYELTVLSDLTTREREVLRHITNELTNKEIAKLLFISPRTVETHRRNLIQKLKVKNSVGLVKAYLSARSIA